MLDSGKNVRNVRLRSTHDDALTITGLSLDWTGATDGQKLRKIKDVTDGSLDVLGSGDTPPVSASGLSLGVGGIDYSGANCPDDWREDLREAVDVLGDVTTDGEATNDSSTGSGGGTDGSASGGTEIDGGAGTDVGELSGFSISSTTTAAQGGGGRLVWRELIR